MDVLVQDRYSFDLNTEAAVKALYDLTQQMEFYQKSIAKAQAEGKDFSAQQRELINIEGRLVAILNQDVKTYDGMAAKKQVLVEVQRNLTKGSKEYIAVAKQVNDLDKRILTTETGRSAKMDELKVKLKGLEAGTKDYAAALKQLNKLQEQSAAETGKLAKTGGGFGAAIAGGLAGAGVVIGIQEVLRYADEALTASSEKLQQKNALLKALRGQEDVQERLLEQADALEARTLVDDDDIIQLDRYLASLGLTEQQISTLNEASVQYAAVTGKSVRASADALIAAQNGQIRGIARLVPEVRTLTKEQLRSGAAADLVAKKFAGSAEALATGIVGAKNEIADFTSNFSEKVGDGITRGLGGIASAFKNTFSGIFGEASSSAFKFLGEFADSIFDLPANLLATVNGVVQVIKALFNGTIANFNRVKIGVQEGYLDIKEAIFGGLDNEDLLRSSELAGQKVANALADPFANGVGLWDIFSQGFRDALKDTDQFSKGIQSTFEDIEGGGPLLPETEKEMKIVAGSIAALEKKLADLRELVSKGIDATNGAALLPYLKQIQLLEKEIQRAKQLQADLLNPPKVLSEEQQAEAGLATLKVGVDTEANKAKNKEDLDKFARELANGVGVEIPATRDEDENRRYYEIMQYFLDAEQKAKDEAAQKDTERREKQKAELLELVDAIGSFSSQVAGHIADVFDRQAQRSADAVAKQKSSLADALANSEDFTAEQIELERARLDKLEKEQRAANERSRAAQLAVVAINTIVAVTKAASQTGVAAPVAILTTLAAIAGGIAAASSLASNAFYEGTDYVPLGKNKPGRDTVPARLTEGEAVLDREDNKNYHPTVKAIRRHLIPAAVLNDFVANYRGGSKMPKSSIGGDAVSAVGGAGSAYIFNAKLTKLEREAEAQTSLLAKIEKQGRGAVRVKKSSASAVRKERFV